MKKVLPSLSLVAIVLVIALGFFAVPQPAHAASCGLDVACWFFGTTDIVYGLIGKIFWWVLIPLAGFVFQLLGTVIDYAIELSLNSSLYTSDAINLAWSVLRDIANMFFIFILIFEGIKTILNLGNAVNVRKTITSVIIAALFLNFSLFFTRVIIDVSNITASWFMQGITAIGDNPSVSRSMGSVLGMEKIATSSKDPSVKDSWSLQSFTTGVLLFVLICVAIYVFFNVIFIIIGRMVAFIFLLITAPIGFVGSLVPQLQSYSKKWWKELNDQAMMLPMFFLMVYLTLFIIDRVSQTLLTPVNNAASGDFSVVNYVMFIIIIMMLLKALDTAKEYSGEIGKVIGGLAKNAAGVALGGLTATAGVALRQTAGKYAFNYTQDKEKMGALQAKAATSMTARLQLAALNKTASSSFDARKTKAGASLMGAMGSKIKVGGIDVDATKVGKTESGGFKAGVEAFEKSEKEWAQKNLGKGKAGELNRLRYAESMKGSVVNKALNAGVTGKGYENTYGNITEEATKKLSSEERADAKKKAAAKQNQVVMAQSAQSLIKKAKDSGNATDVDKAASTGQTLLEEIKAEVAKESKDDYLKFVRGLDLAAENEKQAAANLADLTSKLAQLQGQADFVRKNPGADPVEREQADQQVVEAQAQKSKAEQALKDAQKNSASFAKHAQNVTEEDRKQAAEKFSMPTAEEWTKNAQKYVTSIEQVTDVIERAEKALGEALAKDLTLEQKKNKLSEASSSIDNLIGEYGAYANKKVPKRDKDGNEIKDNKGKPILINSNEREVTAKGRGLKGQATDLKEAYSQKEKELKVGKDENQGGGNQGGGSQPAEGGEKK